MAPIFTQHLLFLFLLFLIPPTLCVSENNVKSLPFEFLKNLEGSKKDDCVKELHQLKAYLNRFGYLENLNKNDVFDDQLESAIMTFQLNHNLNITGVLDSQTVTKILIPRCGIQDIINGTNYMYHHGLSPSQKVNKPKWTKTRLTVSFCPNFPSKFIRPIQRAFDLWAGVTNFMFYPISNERDADIHIAFVSDDHGDNQPFDGPGGVFAHASGPTIGQFHLDASEAWSVGAAPEKVDIVSVAMHQIGHILGLDHSNVEASVMYPYLKRGEGKTTLHKDDILGMNKSFI